MYRSIELLAPAGDLKRLKTAVRFGANAVYIGGKKFSLRSRASNFDLQDIADGVEFAHDHHAKVFVTTNMLLHDEDFEGAAEYLLALEAMHVDAIICASLAFAKLSKQVAPKMEVHLSTQCSTLNQASVALYKEMGFDRIVLARELTLQEIQKTAQDSALPLEVFIHGGMCMSYSGRCTLSNYMTLRDANRGGCAQSCRWKYRLYDEETPIHAADMLFSMSSKDLMAASHIPALMDAGIASLKIEGRMKSNYYIACVVHAYRTLIDRCKQGAVQDFTQYISQAEAELAKAENRPTCAGFFEGSPAHTSHLYGMNGAGVTKEYIADVLSYDEQTSIAAIEVRNYFTTGEQVEILSPYSISKQFTLTRITDSDGIPVTIANKPMQILHIYSEVPLKKYDMLRKVVER